VHHGGGYDDDPDESGGDGGDVAARSSLAQVFVFVVAFQLRRLVRGRLHIPGTWFEDCLCSWFCLPCVVTQMVGQLWRQPSVEPGWTIFNDEPGNLP
jgi:hypothetical protein